MNSQVKQLLETNKSFQYVYNRLKEKYPEDLKYLEMEKEMLSFISHKEFLKYLFPEGAIFKFGIRENAFVEIVEKEAENFSRVARVDFIRKNEPQDLFDLVQESRKNKKEIINLISDKIANTLIKNNIDIIKKSVVCLIGDAFILEKAENFISLFFPIEIQIKESKTLTKIVEFLPGKRFENFKKDFCSGSSFLVYDEKSFPIYYKFHDQSNDWREDKNYYIEIGLLSKEEINEEKILFFKNLDTMNFSYLVREESNFLFIDKIIIKNKTELL